MTSLSTLLGDGIGGSTVVWGTDGTATSADQLADAGRTYVRPGGETDRIGVLMTNDRPTVEVVTGAILSGVRLVSVPLPGRGADLAAYAAFVNAVCRSQGLAEIVVADEYAGLLATTGVPVRRHSELSTRPLAAPCAAGFSLVQFTSGSTGQPRPVLVDDARLGANVSAILETLRPRAGDALVSWLPLAHDMGLIGMLLAGLAAGASHWTGGAEIVLLDPTTFLRDPSRWLQAMSRWRATFTAAPDFGYRLAMRRPPPGDLDLSSLRCAIVGGEIVRAGTLAEFTSTLATHGLHRRALCPAYGMAEVGLAVSMTPLDEEWRPRNVATAALADGVIAAPDVGQPATTLVASGRALTGYTIDAPVGDRVGTIGVSGPSLGVDGATGAELADVDGWYRTGDVGFVDHGVLYVCGRTDDYIVAHGRNVYAPALEVAIGTVDGVRPGRAAAVGLPTGEWVVVAELQPGWSPGEVEQRAVRRNITRSVIDVCAARPDSVVLVRPNDLPLTSSGKLQRHRVRAALVAGGLASV